MARLSWPMSRRPSSPPPRAPFCPSLPTTSGRLSRSSPPSMASSIAEQRQAGRGSELLRPPPAVKRLDVANRARLAAHHHRVGARTMTDVLHAFEQLAGSDACRGERDVARPDQVVHCVHLLEIHAVGLELGALLLGARPDLAK